MPIPRLCRHILPNTRVFLVEKHVLYAQQITLLLQPIAHKKYILSGAPH